MTDVFADLRLAFPPQAKRRKPRTGEILRLHRNMASRVIRITGEAFGVSPFFIVSSSRRAEVVDARDAAIAIIREKMTLSNREIGKIIGGRTASSIFNSLKRSAGRDDEQWIKTMRLSRRRAIKSEQMTKAMETLTHNQRAS